MRGGSGTIGCEIKVANAPRDRVRSSDVSWVGRRRSERVGVFQVMSSIGSAEARRVDYDYVIWCCRKDRRFE